MNLAKSVIALAALGAVLSPLSPAQAAPIDGDFTLGAGFEALTPERGRSHQPGNTVRVYGDPQTHDATLSLRLPQMPTFDGQPLDRPVRANGANPLSNGFARMLALDSGALGLGRDAHLSGNPYVVLGTWGGDGRAILRGASVVAGLPLRSGGSVFAADGFAPGRAVDAGFDGFAPRGGEGFTYGDPPQPFDGQPLFIPTGFSSTSFPTTTGVDPGTTTTTSGNPGSNPGGNPGGGPSGNPGGNPGSGNPSSGNPGQGGQNQNHDHDHDGDHSRGSGGGFGGGWGWGHGGGTGGSGSIAVPEPATLSVLILALLATLFIRNRRFSMLVKIRPMIGRRSLSAIAAALLALAFVPGHALANDEVAGMRDWEKLCNGEGGAIPELIIEGCTAVIGSADESLGDIAIAYNNRGNALRAQEKFIEALSDYSNAVTLAPNDAFPYRNRGVTHGLLGQYELALVDFSQAIRLKDDYASAYLGRAFAEQQLGQPEKAKLDFAKAGKLDSNLAAIVTAQDVGE